MLLAAAVAAVVAVVVDWVAGLLVLAGSEVVVEGQGGSFALPIPGHNRLSVWGS